MSHRLLAALALLLCTFSTRPATAQEPPGMLATADYLFVLRGDWLYQFDVHTLLLKRRVRLADEATPPATEPAAEQAPVAVAVVLEEPVEEARMGGAGGRYGGRGGKAKDASATSVAVDLGLKWLADHQDEDGKWDADAFMKHDPDGDKCSGPGNAIHDVGATGLALLAFLGSGNTLRSGPHKDEVKRACAWLRSQQQENGLIGTNASHAFIYDHAIATYAICEAYGLSNYKLLRQTAQKALDYLESHRNPYGVWRYQPRDNDNDTSVTSWCLIALKSGAFFGLDINEQALELGLAFLDDVTTEDGKCGYTKRGEWSSRMPGDHIKRFPPEKNETLTAAGLWCRFFLGQDPNKVAVMEKAAERILKSPARWDPKAGTIDHYYWYYATYAMFQMGGAHWQAWAKHMLPAVVEHQQQDGSAKGSWDPSGVWGETGGRVYSTALMVLTLEAYYRYTRLIR